MKTKHKIVTLTEDQFDFLEKHHIKLSPHVRDKINQLMEEYKNGSCTSRGK